MSPLHPEAVLFISFGGPEKSEDIMPFLEIVTRGRGIPRERLIDVSHHYEAMGGASPINAITRQQAMALQNELAANGSRVPVFVGQRNWHPFLEDTLRTMKTQGIRQAIGFITAAHRCEASLERYVRAVETAQAAVGPDAPRIDLVDSWFDHPLFIEAIASRIRDAKFPTPSDHDDITTADWIFTAHSIPCSMAKESTYVPELRKTAALVCATFGKKEWSLAYSSRSGNPRDPWLEPDVCDAIRSKADQGRRRILLIPIGFVADHVEVLYDLDVEAKEAAFTSNVQLARAQTVGDHPAFIRMMTSMIAERLGGPERPVQKSSTLTHFRDGPEEKAVGRTSTTCFCFPGSATPPCLKTAPENAVTSRLTPHPENDS